MVTHVEEVNEEGRFCDAGNKSPKEGGEKSKPKQSDADCSTPLISSNPSYIIILYLLLSLSLVIDTVTNLSGV